MPQKRDSSGKANPVELPTATQLYDLLMRDIEPELTSESLKTIAGKYAKETPVQARTRAERYAKAFEAYDKALAAYIAGLNQAIRKQGRAAAASLEKMDRSMEQISLPSFDDNPSA